MAYDGFYLTYKYDRETNYRFDELQKKFPNFRLVKINLEDWENPKIAEAVLKLARLSMTKHFWIIDPDVKLPDDFDFSYRATEWDEMYTQLWNADERNVFRRVVGVKLFKKSDVIEKGMEFVEDAYYMRGDFKEFLESRVVYEPTKESYDAFYWMRDYGKSNYENLYNRFGAIRIVEGEKLTDVHAKCREDTRTDFYYLITPETEVFEGFNFDYSFEFGLDKQNQKVVVWQKENPVTGFTREFHGLGLFPREPIEKITEKAYQTFSFKKNAVYETNAACRDVKFEQHIVGDLLNYADIASACDTQMFWLIHHTVEPYLDRIEEFFPFSYDRDKIHNFNIKLPNGKVVRNGVRLVPKHFDESLQKDVDIEMGETKQLEKVYGRTVKECLSKTDSEFFWMVNPDLDLTSVGNDIISNFIPELYEMNFIHFWKFKNKKGDDVGHGGLALCSRGVEEDKISFHDEIACEIPVQNRIKIVRSRDPYTAYVENENEVFYWLVDTAVELVEDWDWDYYPTIFDIENVFAFQSESKSGSGVYLVHRPHIAETDITAEDFQVDKFKKLIFVDTVACRIKGHPIYYFDEGLYSENTAHYDSIDYVEVVDARGGLKDAYTKVAKLSPGYFWAIDNDVRLTQDDFDRAYFVDKYHKSYYHMWPKQNPVTGFVHQYGGLKLIPSSAILDNEDLTDGKIRKFTFKNKKPVKSKTASSVDIPYDVVFLSYNEPFADENYEKLLSKVPNAKRVHGVKGIFNAHKQAAELADTRMFYVVDADAILLDEFEFSYFPTVWDEDIVHTWKSKNPINDLVYGYGGLKLFPTKLLRNATDWHIDFTTSISEKFKPMPAVANYTAFNTDPFNTWKSAFRECTKLSSSVIHRSKASENNERLNIWCNVGIDREFGEFAISGARAGKEYGELNASNPDELGKINDFAWLKQKFEEENNG